MAGVATLGAAPASAAPTDTVDHYPGQGTTYSLPLPPIHIVAASDGSEIYAATGTNVMMVISPQTEHVIREITLPGRVGFMTLTNTGMLDALAQPAAGSTAPYSFLEISPSTGETTATSFPTGFVPKNFAVTPDGSTAVATTETSGDSVTSTASAIVVHPHAGTLGPTTVLKGLVTIVADTITPDGSKYFVTSAQVLPAIDHQGGSKGGVVEVDTASGAAAPLLVLDGMYSRAAVVSLDGSKLFIANSTGPVDVVDTASLTIEASLDTGDTFDDTLQLTGDGSTVVAGSSDSNLLIDVTTLKTMTIPYNGNSYPATMIPGSSHILAYSFQPPTIVDGRETMWQAFLANEIDAHTGKIVRTAAIGGGDARNVNLVLPNDRDFFFVTPIPGIKEITHVDLDATGRVVTTLRHFGDDRYETAESVAAATVSHTSAARARTLYLVSGQEYPDALGAGPAASHQNAALLLTPPSGLSPWVTYFVKHHPINKIVVVGSTASLPDRIIEQAKALTHYRIPVVRTAGTDRYATNRALISSSFGSKFTHVWVATGTDFPDALSTVSAASHDDEPLLLVNGSTSSLDSATTAFLRRAGVKSINVVGGTTSISTGVESSLASIASTTRIAGSDRYATSELVNDAAFTAPLHDEVMASGANWPDALSSDQLAAVMHAPLAIVPTSCVPDHLAEQIDARSNSLVELIGGYPSLDNDMDLFESC
ncbi:cell wall-binding repeat-containing protein [Frondihabitans australicus]|uniref:cell wall-binding repeat-containing protein n=1 Tax=Frondihabitans australicus TaxID=386892 RepID=UPI001475AE5B|nr:cell wall-binding repeat-containing protein [Frondihabitans australicus]